MTPISRGAQPKKRILYVEDYKDSRDMLAMILGSAGYEVATAANVTDGSSLSRSEPFDMFVLDSRFPDGTGIDLCRRLRASHPYTPIIFYSTAAYASDIEAGLAAGAQKYLVQPTGIYEIEQTIAGLFAGSTGAQA